ncbi:MAG: VWA domain-containing protein [Polyangiaceae bacterium]
MTYPYRAPAPGDPEEPILSMRVAVVHPAVPPDEEITTHAVITVRAPKTRGVRARPRLSGVLAVDVSGSMKGEPLAQVLHSAKRLAEILDDTDQLGLVTFADAAETVAELAPLGESRQKLIGKLGSVRADGRTNIGGALAQAALMFRARDPNERQIVVLLSDGDPNVGSVTSEELGRQASMIKGRDVSVSTLGFGARHNDEILGAIADQAGGRYTFVIDPKLAEPAFIRALGAQLDVVAEQVELVLMPGEDVNIVRVLESPPTAISSAGLRISLSDMVIGDERNVVVELRVRGRHEQGAMRAMTASIVCQPAGTKKRFKDTTSADVLSTTAGSIATDPAAHAITSISLAAEMRAKARGLADKGDYAAAQIQLTLAQAMIAATPGFVKGDTSGLADAYEALADDITVMAKRPPRPDYEIYKRQAKDQGDFAVSGPKPRGGGNMGDAPPSSRLLLDRAYRSQHMPRAHLRVLSGPQAGVRLALTKERFVIGRGQVDLRLADPAVSRQHSVVELQGGVFWLIDLGSTNGPIHQGRRVERLKLEPGVEFEIGESKIRYEEED